ncbi:MAG: biotin carboxyl carrier protein [Myxococcota bacterium]|jgi:biotin carboxyl carrier protein
MEHTIEASTAGVVAAVLVGPDEIVEADQQLVIVEAAAEAESLTSPLP